ncbi:hypothetical protein [Pseudoflavonifractor sp. 524-17]|uniref:hypothetical protein n=1 Tax=Pseudoflavonifractor sp. 524-17 TaxID=2304577 RepID=UPI00325B9858
MNLIDLIAARLTNLTWEERMFVLVWLVNLVVAVLYLLVGALIVSPLRTRKERKAKVEVRHDNRRTYLVRFLIMVLCPVVGPLFFVLSYVLFRLPLWMQPHLEDVVFSKERVKTHLKADEERERDMIPLEEALFLNKGKDLRMVMMNTIRGDVRSALGVILLALNSEDPETAHYAASVLSGELDEFRDRVRRLCRTMAEEEEEQTAAELELLSYMDGFLKQGAFVGLEQKKQVRVMASAAESLFGKDAAQLTVAHYESVCLRLMEAGEFDSAEQWCRRLVEQYPDCLAAYTCRLKLYFSTKDREAFFTTMSALKQSKVVIDQETLELIKVFGDQRIQIESAPKQETQAAGA